MAYIGRSVDIGMFEKQVLTPDSSTTTFTLTYAVGSANSLLVVYGGVVQEPQVAYSVSGGGQSIAFSEAPAIGTTTYIIYLGKQLTTPRAAGQETTKQTFTGNGSTVTYTLTDPPVVPAGIMVFVDGILQREGSGNNYVSSGSTITFSTAPDTSAEIDVYTLVKEKVSIDTVADGSITVAKLAASHPTWDAGGNFVVGGYLTSTSKDNTLSIANATDTTKIAQFSAASVTTGTTAVFTLPAASTTLAGLGTTQTFSGTTNTFSGTLTVSGALSVTSASFTRTATTQAWLDGSMTTATWTVGGTAQTGAITLGRSTAAQTVNIATGATTASTTKAINIGTAGVSTSVTNITSGSSVSGALVTHTWNAGANNMTLDSSGNVGIATTLPKGKLHVAAGATSVVAGLFASSTFIAEAPLSTPGQAFITFGNTVGGTYTYGAAAINYGTQSATGGGYGDLIFSTRSVTTDTAPTERMRIGNDGNVGIGTGGAATSKLQVVGTTNSGYATSNAITSGGSAISNSSALTSGSSLRLTANFGGAVAFTGRASELVFGADNGNFGSGGGFSQANLGAITAISETGNAVTLASSMLFYTTAGNNINERMRITSAGNVGIGTNAPANVLTLNSGFVQVGNGVGGGGGVWFPYSSDAAGRTWRVRTDLVGYGDFGFEQSTTQTGTTWATKFLIDQSGDVIIGGTTSTATAKLNVYQADSSQRVVHFENTRNVSGDENLRLQLGSNCNNTSSYSLISTTGGADKFYLYGNGTYGTVSDRTLKKNIETARSGYVEDLCKLRVVKYNWAADAEETPKELGWIAQEVAEVFPGMVQDSKPNDDGDVHKQVKTSVLPFMLLKAIQEQQAIIVALTARIEALENK